MRKKELPVGVSDKRRKGKKFHREKAENFRGRFQGIFEDKGRREKGNLTWVGSGRVLPAHAQRERERNRL